MFLDCYKLLKLPIERQLLFHFVNLLLHFRMTGSQVSLFLGLLPTFIQGIQKITIQAVKKGDWQGIQVGKEKKLEVSHLQFADDLILFGRDDVRSIKTIKIVLILFQSVCGLKINLTKSFIYGIGVKSEKVHEMNNFTLPAPHPFRDSDSGITKSTPSSATFTIY